MKITMTVILGMLMINVYADGGHLGRDDHHKNPLFQAMGFTDVNEVELTTVEAIEVSDAIVQGHIVSITEGRVIQHINGYSSPNRTALIKVEVSKVLKGKVGKFVYFEYLVGAMPAKYMDDRKYADDMLLLLRKPTWSKESYTFTDSPQGLMHEVDTLYTLTTQRGLIIEDRSQGTSTIVQPLVGGDPLFVGQSFDHLEKEIPALDSGGSYGFDIKPIESSAK